VRSERRQRSEPVTTDASAGLVGDPAPAADAHVLAGRCVPPGARVLRIGVGSEEAARLLVERQCRVSAIDIEPAASRAAAPLCQRVVTGDIEQIDLHEVFPEELFDAIIAVDVLDEVREPAAILLRLAEVLAPGGRLVVSVSNVAHAAVRFQLLQGRFTGTDRGLLDTAHLHFFDRPAVESLLADAGLDIVDRLRVVRGATETEIAIDLTAFPAAVIDTILSDPDAETYQFVFVCRPRPEQARGTLPSLNAARQVRRLLRERDALRAALDAAEQRALQMSTRIAKLLAIEDEFRHAQSDLQIKDAYSLELHTELLRLQAQCTIEADRRKAAEAQLAAATSRASYRLIQRVERSLANRPAALRLAIVAAHRFAP
jgi:2-polyprenyl-3-methyl-5-hydroxy-6-metoxy-1,4-benzoquinol methylase